ncbi:MAG: hypothetical protein RL711_439 [Bacteroidota bacterium]
MRSLILIGIIFQCLLLTSCSQESTGRISKAYHNTTARFNAYFLAKEKMIEIENAVLQKTESDYNKILDLYPTYDTNFAKTLRPMFDECIKKSSLPIQWHKNSKWVDNSYILIGKCRLYALDYTNASATFKYVNAKGTDENDKHQALILLMRTYIETKDFTNALIVDEFLSKETLNKDNTRDFALTKALFYQLHGEYAKEAEQLEIALPNIKVKDQKSRVLFILAQIYQLYQEDEKSHDKYQLVLKNNPPYELSFFTKLYMAQVTSLNSTSDTKKIYKYFKKLLKDQKNKEYKDKMYYEMGKFELKQNNIDEGLSYLKKSVQEDLSPVQKAYSYLKMGEVYYEKVKNYKVAQNYYDSCLATLPKSNLRYKEIELRGKILNDFVEQLTIIELQDSLLLLANMDKLALDKFLDQAIAMDVEKQKNKHEADLKRKEKKEEQEATKSNTSTLAFGDGNAKWYFYNSQLLVSGKAEFIKKWGQRNLEDDWRRSGKEISNSDENVNDNNLERSQPKEIVKEEFKPIPLDKNKLLKTIPFEQEAKDSAVYKSAEAHFKLGRIYKLKLKEPINALETYQKHLDKFPDNKRHTEVMYAMYLMYRELKEETKETAMKKRILDEYPHSLYAKLIKNPNYLIENKVIIAEIKDKYRTIFMHFEAKQYDLADTLIGKALLQYPDNEIEDKFVLLKAIIKGKQRDYTAYKKNLIEFKEKYKSSTAIKYANQLLEGINNYVAPDTNLQPKTNQLLNDSTINKSLNQLNDSTKNEVNILKPETATPASDKKEKDASPIQKLDAIAPAIETKKENLPPQN